MWYVNIHFNVLILWNTFLYVCMYLYVCTIDIDVFPCMVTMETCMDDDNDDDDYNKKYCY